MKTKHALVCLFSLSLAACASEGARETSDDVAAPGEGVETTAASRDDGVAFESAGPVLQAPTRSFTLPPSHTPPGGFTTPGGGPIVLDYELCCFGNSCSVSSGICAFSTWSCTTRTETAAGTVYSGCTCTKHCG